MQTIQEFPVTIIRVVTDRFSMYEKNKIMALQRVYNNQYGNCQKESHTYTKIIVDYGITSEIINYGTLPEELFDNTKYMCNIKNEWYDKNEYFVTQIRVTKDSFNILAKDNIDAVSQAQQCDYSSFFKESYTCSKMIMKYAFGAELRMCGSVPEELVDEFSRTQEKDSLES